MDNFMDKLAQRLTAQEMIKANSAADAAELERLQKQLDQYDACLQEMRKLSLKNVETTDKIGELLEESIQKIQSYQTNGEDLNLRLDALKEEFGISGKEITSSREEMNASLEELKSSGEKLQAFIDGFAPSMEALLEKANDYVHKENVKVYRNVQAVVVEEAKKQAEAMEAQQKKKDKGARTAFVFTVLTFLAVVADIALKLLEHFNLF